jgi:hypothetical protein
MQDDGRRFCAGLLTFRETFGGMVKLGPVLVSRRHDGSELFRPALIEELSDYQVLETSTSSLSFR